MPDKTKQAGPFVSALVFISLGVVLLFVGLFIAVAFLSIYGLPFTAVIFLVNALLHFVAGSAWLGDFNTVAIGYTLGLAAKILRKVL
jgi:hypothetical protein